MDYATIIHTIVNPFLSNPDALLIREVPSEDSKNDVTILVCAESNDIGRLIGKKGCVASAIRDIVSIAGKLEQKRVHLKFESFGEEKAGE